MAPVPLGRKSDGRRAGLIEPSGEIAQSPTTVVVVNIEPHENMELLCLPSIHRYRAQQPSCVGRCGVAGPQIPSHTPVGKPRPPVPDRRPAPPREEPKQTSADRLLRTWLCESWNDWRSSLMIVKPETVMVWHRSGFRRFRTWKVRHSRSGRPTVLSSSASTSARPA
jgi:hypothetical protein